MESYVRRLNTLITSMTLTDLRHIVDGLRTAHIAIFHDRVVIEPWLCEFQHIGRHISPAVSVLTVSSSQSHSVADMV